MTLQEEIEQLRTALGERDALIEILQGRIDALHAQIRDGDAVLAHFKALADIDPLTGLRNRRGLENLWRHIVDRAERDRQEVVVMTCDINYFKDFNDKLGHAVGDEALIGVATRLRGLLRVQDVIVRSGGDEFVIIATIARGSLNLAQFARRVFEATRFEVSDSERSMLVELSIGAVLHKPGAALEDELKAADRHLYVAKGFRGSNTPTVSVTPEE